MPRPKERNAEEKESGSVRLSVSLSPKQYEYLDRVAKRQRVSLAWVVRDAILRYMDAEAPLFARQD